MILCESIPSTRQAIVLENNYDKNLSMDKRKRKLESFHPEAKIIFLFKINNK